MNKLFFYFLVLLFISCKEEKKTTSQIRCFYTIYDLKDDYEKKIDIFYNEKDSLYEVTDKREKIDTSVFGYYNFFASGKLKSYFYMRQNGDAHSYKEEYDSTGKLIEKEGNNLVDFFLVKRNADTAIVTFFFFALNKKYNHIDITTSNGDTIKSASFTQSNYFTNMKIACFAVPFKKSSTNDIKLYTKCYYTDTCANYEATFIDTTNLAKMHY